MGKRKSPTRKNKMKIQREQRARRNSNLRARAPAQPLRKKGDDVELHKSRGKYKEESFDRGKEKNCEVARVRILHSIIKRWKRGEGVRHYAKLFFLSFSSAAGKR